MYLRDIIVFLVEMEKRIELEMRGRPADEVGIFIFHVLSLVLGCLHLRAFRGNVCLGAGKHVGSGPRGSLYVVFTSAYSEFRVFKTCKSI